MIWCQEEPRNMGAWTFVSPIIEWVLEHVKPRDARCGYAGRAASASTAHGTVSKHIHEQKALVADALQG